VEEIAMTTLRRSNYWIVERARAAEARPPANAGKTTTASNESFSLPWPSVSAGVMPVRPKRRLPRNRIKMQLAARVKPFGGQIFIEARNFTRLGEGRASGARRFHRGLGSCANDLAGESLCIDLFSLCLRAFVVQIKFIFLPQRHKGTKNAKPKTSQRLSG
jgi:hypothetical protein